MVIILRQSHGWDDCLSHQQRTRGLMPCLAVSVFHLFVAWPFPRGIPLISPFS